MNAYSFAISSTKFKALLEGKTIKVVRVIVPKFDVSIGDVVGVQAGYGLMADAIVVAVSSRFYKLKTGV